jgi:hypothetical protein
MNFDEQFPGGIRLTVVDRCELIDWKDSCVDAAIKRTEAAWSERVRLLELAEEGAKEAFGTVVQQKREIEKERDRLRGLLDGTHQMIREYASGKRLPNARYGTDDQ